MHQNLKRFEETHNRYFQTALSEIKNGKKVSHWMWYIFPQVKGLGFSETSKYYGIDDLEHVQAFLDHPILGKHICSITAELLALKTNNATSVFGKPDDMKLKSSMTMFALAPRTNPIFQQVLDKYFDGNTDLKTIKLLVL